MDEQNTTTITTPATEQANQNHVNAVQCTVTYALSAEGQKAALLAGKPAAKVQTISGRINPELLKYCSINADGSDVPCSNR